MKKMIKSYEQFIEKKASEKLSDANRGELAEYHREMVTNFQHERLVHLLIMLFFITVALILLGILAWSIIMYGFILEMLAFYIMTGIVTILAIAYVKHYYFLENHIQNLYKYSAKLRGYKEEK